ncbi:MAG: hypothetical protein ACLP8S_14630 [Solirubrobacteraceae bacterium]
MATLTDDFGGIWRMLIPLSRRHPSYHAMHVAGKALERAWPAWRERYRLAGKRPEMRSRRRESVPCQLVRTDRPVHRTVPRTAASRFHRQRPPRHAA